MKNLIPASRTDRIREMTAYEEKGYSIQNKDRYIMISKVNLEHCKKTYTYGMQVTKDDLYFFIINQDANIYLTIFQIYELLNRITELEGDFLIVALKKQLSMRAMMKIKYKNLEYKIPQIIELSKKGKVLIPDSGLEISYEELFILINLIQAKSSALFKRGKAKDKRYAKGLIRLLIVLLSKKEKVDLLDSVGWIWNDVEKQYNFTWNGKAVGRAKYKYYLTQGEYKTII